VSDEHSFLLQRAQPGLLQPGLFRGGEMFGNSGQRLTPPQRQCRAQQPLTAVERRRARARRATAMRMATTS